MYAIILLSILASGYFYLSQHPLYYYKLHRFDGQKLYLDTAVNGIGFMVFSFILIIIFYNLLSQNSPIYLSIKEITKNPDKFSLNDLFLLSAAALSYLIAYLKIRIYILSTTEEIYGEIIDKENKDGTKLDHLSMVKYHMMNKIFKDSPLDHLFLKALNEKTILMLCLEDRKVYIGQVKKMGEPTENKGLDQEIEIRPIFSGYRNPKTLEVALINEYRKVDNIRITIKQNKIVSATPFSKKAYLYHKNKNKNQRKSMYNLEPGKGKDQTSLIDSES